MPGLDGLGVLAEMRKSGLATPVIVQTSNGSIDTVVGAMRAGAVDFVVKPAGAERLQVSIKNALRVGTLEDEVRRMRRRASLSRAAAALSLFALTLVPGSGRAAEGAKLRIGFQKSSTLIALLACGVCWLVWSALSRYWP